MPGTRDLPSTLRRSPPHARHIYEKALENAERRYGDGDGERAHRTAFAALKREYEKVGDRWTPKKRRGPSDPRAASGRARQNVGETFGGIDYLGHSKAELYARAREMGIAGRSTMSKRELARAIARKQH